MIDKFGRIDWDTLWMTIAFVISQRSIDNLTKHGAVIVDKNNKILSLGYNSFPRDCLDDKLPLTRPLKYGIIPHAEINSIINSNKNLEGATAYITGEMCSICFSQILNADISKIIYGPVGSKCLTNENLNLINLMNISKKTGKHKIEIVKYEDIKKIDEIYEFLNMVEKYIKEKTENA